MEFCRKYFTEIIPSNPPPLGNALIKSGISQAPAQKPTPKISRKNYMSDKIGKGLLAHLI
jgi:hypothetical protein